MGRAQKAHAGLRMEDVSKYEEVKSAILKRNISMRRVAVSNLELEGREKDSHTHN